jgi:hypothetical protein
MSSSDGPSLTSSHSQVLREFDPLAQEPLDTSVQTDSPTTPPRRATHVRTSSLPAPSAQTLSQRRASSHSRTASITSTRPDPPHEPPPRPEAFDFNLFLEQMRHKSASSIARYVKSFLREFEKKKWTSNEQVKIIHDFLEVKSRMVYNERSLSQPRCATATCGRM